MSKMFVAAVVLCIAVCGINGFSVPPNTDIEGEITCERLRRLRAYRHIECQDDGSFSPIQCSNNYCVCVNVTTGNPISTQYFRKGDRTESYCEKLAICGEVFCTLFCPNGYRMDSNGCRLCSCLPSDCTYTDPIVIIQSGCRPRCVQRKGNCYTCDGPNCNTTTGPVTPVRCGDYEEAVKRGYGWGTCRQKLERNDTCERPIDENEDEDDDDDDNMDDDGNDDDDTTLESVPETTLALLSSEEEDEILETASNEVRRVLVGSSARRATRIISKPNRQCRSGYYCRRTGLRRGQCKPANGPCFTKEGRNSDECDSNGYFKPRYCKALGQSGRMRCVCVHPRNGTELADTEVTFSDRGNEDSNEQEKPKCSDRVYGVCSAELKGQRYRIRNGGRHVDLCSCRTCRCFLGKIYCSTRRNCTGCPTDTTNCRLSNGTMIGHGRRGDVDCNVCHCRNGRNYCSDKNCGTNTTFTDDCRRCLSEKVGKVCGPNGKTYINRCFAVYCAGVASVDLLKGPCPSIDPCRRFPCQTGQTCLRRGGVSCLAQNTGCRPDTLRFCVNVTDLVCDNSTATSEGITRNNTDRDGDGIGDGDVDPRDTSVCASNGMTYRSTCHLLQSTVNVHVVHAGKCNASQCIGGQVCGTDGVTYDNICALRTQSANARLDYAGRCMNDTEVTAEEMCSRIRASGRCKYNSTNCPNCLVQPAVGCCPICGGGLIAILDRESIGNASAYDKDLETLDGLMNRIISDQDVFLRPANSCAIEATLTDGGNIEFTLIPLDGGFDPCYCRMAASNITTSINNNTSGGSRINKRNTDTSNTQSPPPSYQYLLGATEAQVSTGNTGEQSTGAGMMSFSLATIAVCMLLAAALYA